MRFVVLVAAALCLSGCAWVKQKLPWETPPVPAPVTAPTPKPAPAEVPPKPRPHVEQPAAPASAPQLRGDVPATESAVDRETRCRRMADNRADDAKGLGASPADQAAMRADTLHDCMQPAVK